MEIAILKIVRVELLDSDHLSVTWLKAPNDYLTLRFTLQVARQTTAMMDIVLSSAA